MVNNNTYTFSDYSEDITRAALPWIAFAIFAFLVLLGAIVLRFVRGLCCKQQINERKRCIKLTCLLLSFIVTFFALGSCSFIIYYSDQTFQSLQQVQCAGCRIPYTISGGYSSSNWTGLNYAVADTQMSMNQLNTTYYNSTCDLWDSTDQWLTTSTFDEDLLDYYNQYNKANLSNPNPYNTQPVPVNYTWLLGPINDNLSYTGQINYEFYQKIAPIIDAMENLKNITLALNQNLNYTVSSLNSSLYNLNSFVTGNQEISNNTDSWILDNQAQIITSWRSFTFSIVVWGWFICIGVLIQVYSQAMGKPALAHGLCCFWLFTGIIAMLGFLASVGTLGVGIVVNDSCGLIDELMTETGIYKYDVIIPNEITNFMNTCLNEKGDLASYLNLTDFIAIVSDIAASNTTLSEFIINSSLSNFSSIQINIKKTQVPPDYNNILSLSVDIQDTPDYNLGILNKYTNNETESNYQSNCTTHTSDKWVFLIDFCYPFPQVPPQDPNKFFGSEACLVITDWAPSQVESRYSNLNCQNSSYIKEIELYQNTLYNYTTNANNLFTIIQYDLSTINNTIESLVQNLINQSNLINAYFTSPNQTLLLMNSVVGPQGLNNGLDCSFVHGYFLNLKTALCTNSLENIYEVFVFVFVLSFLMLVVEIINLYLSRALLSHDIG